MSTYPPLDAVITPFLKKLLSLSTSVPAPIGGWDAKGTTFIVSDGTAFESLLRNYFKGTLQTFIRQLHFYGFSKTDLPRLGPTSWSFSHPCFRKDAPHLVAEIRRKISVSNSAAAAAAGASGIQATASMASGLGIRERDNKLEGEMQDLKEKVKMLQDTVNQLVILIGTNFAQQQQQLQQAGPKKRKLSDFAAVASTATTTTSSSSSSSSGQMKYGESPMSMFQEFAGLPLMDVAEMQASTSSSSSSPSVTQFMMFPKVKSEDEEVVATSFADDFIKDLATGFPDEMDTPKAFSQGVPFFPSNLQQLMFSQKQQQQLQFLMKDHQ